MQYAPAVRKTLSCILAAPQPGQDAATIVRRITAATGLKAYIKSEFFWLTVWWYIKNTGIPVAFGATVLIGFVVGLATLFGTMCLQKGMPPFFMPRQLPFISLVAILFLCWLAASLGIRTIRSLEPAIVFRG